MFIAQLNKYKIKQFLNDSISAKKQKNNQKYFVTMTVRLTGFPLFY